ncbi:hypothetical protein [Paraburkholderia nemoris]|uniref:hypothetical protein n=1 Tax=Paraburkholderia nemoris TaxID=2793076 RepID=UPI001B2F63BB|nr:hypothetical protein [Paraburkholderia nemoris]CAE6792929.1 hypothetical protein LMG22931_05040 [Paraburkholderia nemoris]
MKTGALLIGALLFPLGSPLALAQHAEFSLTDASQIEATVKQFYALSHPDASCVFSKVDDSGNPTDLRVRSKAFREQSYTRIFKPIFSRSLFERMKQSCVLAGNATGMLDIRVWDSGIDSDSSHYGNDVNLKLTRPVTMVQATSDHVRVRVDWAEFIGPSRRVYTVGRTDLMFLKEGDRWLIDDALTLGAANGRPGQFDMPVNDFDNRPGVIHLRD